MQSNDLLPVTDTFQLVSVRSDSNPESLPDQAALYRAISGLLEQGQGEAVKTTLVLLQLANFFEIRTWVGRAEASALLADLTEVLSAALPAAVQLFRCDNYEFALLLNEESAGNAVSISNRLQDALHNAVSETLPAQLQLHCAAGVAVLNSSVTRAEVLLARARRNLSNPHCSQAETDLQCPALARKIVAGLKQGKLLLNYQACLKLAAGKDELVEVRSSMPGAGLASGSKLFDAAVQNALGEALDRSVINQCLQKLAQGWRPPGRLLVNLSLNSLVSAAFHAWLPTRLRKYPGLGEHLVLQISELDILVAQHHLAEFGRSLEAAQLALGVSHFGCSPDAMQILPLIPCRYIRLDASLTCNAGPGSARFQTLQAIMRELHSRDIDVIASQVEHLRELPGLWQAELDYVQGHCLSTSGRQIAVPVFCQVELP